MIVICAVCIVIEPWSKSISDEEIQQQQQQQPELRKSKKAETMRRETGESVFKLAISVSEKLEIRWDETKP